MSTALDNIFVLDLTTEYWSSLGGALLADFGARVVRIENLAAPQPSRPDGADGRPGWDHDAELVQRNKLSLALNLDDDTGRGILRDLVRRADVFVTDWSHARVAQHGFEYASLAALKPDLIYARGSGFGPKGPDRDLPALDELAAARTGMMPILPQPGQPPVYAGAGQMYTAVMLAFGIVLALHHRSATGEGQEVDASLFAGNMYGASLDVQAFLAMGGERFLHPVSRMDAGNPMSGVLYPSQDGRWVCLTMPDTDRWWPGLAPITGLDVDDPRFNTHDKRCGENRLEMIRVLEERVPPDTRRRTGSRCSPSTSCRPTSSKRSTTRPATRRRYATATFSSSSGPASAASRPLGFPIFMSDTPARAAAHGAVRRPALRRDPPRRARATPRIASRNSRRTGSSPSDGAREVSRWPLHWMAFASSI